jgi:DNA-binding transcriptional regulator PaaX
MSMEATAWALDAPVPRAGSSACAFVLILLADSAGPAGTWAQSSIQRLAQGTRLPERAVRVALDRLEAHGVIRLAAAKAGGAVVYDLAMDEETRQEWQAGHSPEAGGAPR